jgi:hypothetical protein
MARMMLAIGLALAVAGGAFAQENEGASEPFDRHAGYYYPTPGQIESYVARVSALPDSDRTRRLGFVIGITKEQMSQKFAPTYAVFAKGDEAEKLIIVGLEDGRLNTIYRARALFATLTAVARVTPFFQENAPEEEATFFDLLKLLGFKQVTITDGVAFAHQVLIE